VREPAENQAVFVIGKKDNKETMKNFLYLIILTFCFSSCILRNHEDVEYLGKNQKAFLNYSELLQLISNERVFLKIPIDISKHNNVEKIKVFVDTICQKYENNDSLSKCWDFLAIRYNYEDNSFKTNKDEYYNVNIPAIAITCHQCFITFKEMDEIVIEYRKDTIFINNYLLNIYDTIISGNSNMVEHKIDSVFNKKMLQFGNSCCDYKDFEQTDEMFDDYVESRNYIPLHIRIQISQKYLITDIEPIFTIIYNSYLKSLNKHIYDFTKHEIDELTINEMKLFGKNLFLYLTISPPLYETLNQEKNE